MKTAQARATTGVGVLHKTLDIIETLRLEQDGTRLANISRHVDLPKATVYRILTTTSSAAVIWTGAATGTTGWRRNSTI